MTKSTDGRNDGRKDGVKTSGTGKPQSRTTTGTRRRRLRRPRRPRAYFACFECGGRPREGEEEALQIGHFGLGDHVYSAVQISHNLFRASSGAPPQADIASFTQPFEKSFALQREYLLSFLLNEAWKENRRDAKTPLFGTEWSKNK